MAQIRTLDGSAVDIGKDALDELSKTLGGDLRGPGDTVYDEACDIWNAMVERQPAFVARCRSSAEVSKVVKFAAAHKVLLSVRGRGHHRGTDDLGCDAQGAAPPVLARRCPWQGGCGLGASPLSRSRYGRA